MSILNDLLNKIIPSMSTTGPILYLSIFAVVGIAFWVLLDMWSKKPKVYPATIFQRIGGSWKPDAKTSVLKFNNKNKKGYYVRGCQRKQVFDLDDALLTGQGKPHFYLMKLEDQGVEVYIPLKINETITLLDKKDDDGEPLKVKSFGFMAEAKLRELDSAAVEGVEEDTDKFKWEDKLQTIAMLANIGGLLIIFLIAAYVFKQVAPVIGEVKLAVVEIGKIAPEFARIADNLDILVEYWYAVKPPPG